jgi:hypothetical protein
MELVRGESLRAKLAGAEALPVRQVLQIRLLELSSRAYVSPFLEALIHVALGEKELAIADLERAYAVRAHEMTFLKMEPQLDDLRGDPRFADLQRRVGM